MVNKEYFHDGDLYVVSIDRGQNGFFVLNRNKTSDWEFVIPGSIKWNALHQDIYYAGHNLDLCPKEITDELPEIPPIPKFKSMEWKDTFLPLKKMPIRDYPYLEKKIKENKGEASFWFVLHEDLYETHFGDGRFLYFYGEVYETELAANSRMKVEEEEAKKRESPYTNELSISIGKFKFMIENNNIVPYDYYPKIDEHYSIENIIERIEEIISNTNGQQWGGKGQ